MRSLTASTNFDSSIEELDNKWSRIDTSGRIARWLWRVGAVARWTLWKMVRSRVWGVVSDVNQWWTVTWRISWMRGVEHRIRWWLIAHGRWRNTLPVPIPVSRGRSDDSYWWWTTSTNCMGINATWHGRGTFIHTCTDVLTAGGCKQWLSMLTWSSVSTTNSFFLWCFPPFLTSCTTWETRHWKSCKIWSYKVTALRGFWKQSILFNEFN